METKGCHNCEHQYVNHKRCDLPFGVKCNLGEKWEQRKDVLSVFKEQEKLNIPAVSSSAKHTWKDEWRVCSGFEHHKKLLTDNHMINIKIRKDGMWHEIEADWLKRLVRQEFLGEE